MLTTFGDGATSEGEWHESLNFAAVHTLPIVFLCENNEWAISTPLSKQMGQPDVYKRAAGYGMPGAASTGWIRSRVTRRSATRSTALAPAAARHWSRRSAIGFLAHTTDDDDRTLPIARRGRRAPQGRPGSVASSACWSNTRC